MAGFSVLGGSSASGALAAVTGRGFAGLFLSFGQPVFGRGLHLH